MPTAPPLPATLSVSASSPWGLHANHTGGFSRMTARRILLASARTCCLKLQGKCVAARHPLPTMLHRAIQRTCSVCLLYYSASIGPNRDRQINLERWQPARRTARRGPSHTLAATGKMSPVEATQDDFEPLPSAPPYCSVPSQHGCGGPQDHRGGMVTTVRCPLSSHEAGNAHHACRRCQESPPPGRGSAWRGGPGPRFFFTRRWRSASGRTGPDLP